MQTQPACPTAFLFQDFSGSFAIQLNGFPLIGQYLPLPTKPGLGKSLSLVNDFIAPQLPSFQPWNPVILSIWPLMRLGQQKQSPPQTRRCCQGQMSTARTQRPRRLRGQLEKRNQQSRLCYLPRARIIWSPPHLKIAPVNLGQPMRPHLR